MFGGKKLDNQKPGEDYQVESIPPEFYAGANPVIKFRPVEKEVGGASGTQAVTPAEKKDLDKKTAAGGVSDKHPANLFTSGKAVVVASVVLFVVFIIGAGVYYWLQLRKANLNQAILPAPQTGTTEMVAEELVQPEPVVEAVPTSTVTEEPQVSPNISLDNVPIEFPSRLMGDSPDLDEDDISDMAEDLFATDIGSADSDGDKYPDGVEVYNLYNPAGTSPQRLLESGTVKEFVNPVYGYKLYYPANWAVGAVDINYKDVLLSTITGENIEVRVFDLPSSADLSVWMSQNAPTERVEDLVDFSTAFKEGGKSRNDFLVYYFRDNARVYVIAYHGGEAGVVNYRMVIKMMARSFQMPVYSETTVAAPELTPPIIENDVTAGRAPDTTGVVSSTDL